MIEPEAMMAEPSPPNGPESDALRAPESGPATPSSADATASAPPLDLIEQVLTLRLPLSEARQRVVEEFEQRYVLWMLREHGGRVSKAAEASGVARRYFQVLKARRCPSPATDAPAG